jgi:hypothetical protein
VSLIGIASLATKLVVQMPYRQGQFARFRHLEQGVQ